ncbi:TolC family protein [Thalassotalea fonticola]|uniref:TolC family protein n=1 Tax=Thalassotalea fonticola TaxID=3065649 RepID=A0ABZ0GMB2_9GAMM|nr:TolC family protein [Colwelliaceae bacterium S1-1]
MFFNFRAACKQAHKLRRTPKWLVFISALLLSHCSIAQEQGGTSLLTLSSAIKLTLKENPSLKVFKFKEEALAGQQKTQNLTPGYELGFEIENFAGSGDLSAVDSAEFTVSISSIVEMGDKRAARTGLVQNHSLVLAAERKVQALTLLAEVTRRYINVLTAQERLALAQQSSQLAEETLEEVEKRAKVGNTPKAEIKRALAALGNTRLTLSAEQQNLQYSKIALTMMWNETTPEFTHVEGNLFQFSPDVAFDTLFNKVKQNPAILVFASEQRLKDAELRLARTSSITDIKWSVGIKHIQELDDTALTASFSVPLFAAKNNAGAIISAQAARDEVAARKELSLVKMHSQLYRAFANRKQAIFTVNSLNNTIIPTLEEALSETQIAYQNGIYSYLDYITARQELLFAQRAKIDAAAAALQYGTDIEELIAEPLPASQHRTNTTFQGIAQ